MRAIGHHGFKGIVLVTESRHILCCPGPHLHRNLRRGPFLHEDHHHLEEPRHAPSLHSICSSQRPGSSATHPLQPHRLLPLPSGDPPAPRPATPALPTRVDRTASPRILGVNPHCGTAPTQTSTSLSRLLYWPAGHRGPRAPWPGLVSPRQDALASLRGCLTFQDFSKAARKDSAAHSAGAAPECLPILYHGILPPLSQALSNPRNHFRAAVAPRGRDLPTVNLHAWRTVETRHIFAEGMKNRPTSSTVPQLHPRPHLGHTADPRPRIRPGCHTGPQGRWTQCPPGVTIVRRHPTGP
ncbi:uncharacterized protein LOC124522474 isoform X2 [Lynx rufus]|uniref:uncharacterized protein LOC124522474 isoform X2 n=1 Tax=Lynx rufus TaxID=61384 RepID=UPI001F12294B|nr:uncharacterized protein LOC124522474 isoform X2 [Lynx rufus]